MSNRKGIHERGRYRPRSNRFVEIPSPLSPEKSIEKMDKFEPGIKGNEKIGADLKARTKKLVTETSKDDSYFWKHFWDFYLITVLYSSTFLLPKIHFLLFRLLLATFFLFLVFEKLRVA